MRELTIIALHEQCNWVRAVWKPGWARVRWEFLRAQGWTEHYTVGPDSIDHTTLGLPRGTSEWQQRAPQAEDVTDVLEFINDAIEEFLEHTTGAAA